jgi:hypothetical protein
MSASRLYANTAKNNAATAMEVVEPIHKTALFKDDSSLEDLSVDILHRLE